MALPRADLAHAPGRRGLPGTTTRSGLRTALRHGNPRGLPRPFVDRMYDDMDAGTSRAILRLYRSVEDPSAVGRRHADALRPLDRPALVIWGAHDPYIPVAMADQQREAFPSAEIEILDPPPADRAMSHAGDAVAR